MSTAQMYALYVVFIVVVTLAARWYNFKDE